MRDEAGMPMLVEPIERVKIGEGANELAKAFADADGYLTFRRVDPPIESRKSAVDEQARIDERIGKLCAFLQSDAYRSMPHPDQHLLDRQLSHMRDYAHILFMRVARFG